MREPTIAVLVADGTNCHVETRHALERAGGRADMLHLNDLLRIPSGLHIYQGLVIPGGFSYGDDIRAGIVFARQLLGECGEAIRTFTSSGKPVLGICNGFQVLVQAGILPYGGRQRATLTANMRRHFECRRVHLKVVAGDCGFVTGLEGSVIRMPVAHAEGRFAMSEEAAALLESSGQITFQYATPEGTLALGEGSYPANPNGSVRAIAGITDGTKRVLGLMPHPERPIFDGRLLEPSGLPILRNMVRMSGEC